MKNKLFTTSLILFSLTSYSQFSQYRFNGNADDEIGTLHGVVTGAELTTDRFGLDSAAYAFNQLNKDYIAVNDAPNIFGKAFGLSVWFNALPNDSTPMKIIDWYACGFSTCLGDGIYSIGLNNDRLYFGMRTDGTSALYLDTNLTTTNTYDDNAWHHAVFTFDSTSGNIAIYIDNQVFKSFNRPFSNINSVPSASLVPMSIGRRDNSRVGQSLDHFHGKIDDVSIYNEFLSASKVDSLFKVNDTATIPNGIFNQEVHTMKISPNPFSNNISITNSGDEGILHYAISNAQGTMILSGERNLTAGQGIIQIGDLGTIPSGIYFLTTINAQGKRNSFRMIKE